MRIVIEVQQDKDGRWVARATDAPPGLEAIEYGPTPGEAYVAAVAWALEEAAARLRTGDLAPFDEIAFASSIVHALGASSSAPRAADPTVRHLIASGDALACRITLPESAPLPGERGVPYPERWRDVDAYLRTPDACPACKRFLRAVRSSTAGHYVTGRDLDDLREDIRSGRLREERGGGDVRPSDLAELTERDYRARVAAGAWPAHMRHSTEEPWYDYTRVVVTWRGEATPVTYAFAPRGEHDALDGSPGRSAYDRAQVILGDHARGLDVSPTSTSKQQTRDETR